jgi:hypothetical protein
MTAKQTTAADVTIQIDNEGGGLGKFNDNNDPIVSYLKSTDEWMLAFKTPTGTACASLGVTGAGASTEAVTAAREHLRAHQTTAAQGS